MAGPAFVGFGCPHPVRATAKGRGHTPWGHPLPFPKTGSEDMAFISASFKLHALSTFIPFKCVTHLTTRTKMHSFT